MTNEKIFPKYDFECRRRWADSEFPVAAQAVVADPDGRGSVTLWIARDICLRLRRWTIYIHSFLNQSNGIFAPQSILPWLSPIRQAEVGPCQPLNLAYSYRDLSQGYKLGNWRFLGNLTLSP